MGGADVRSTGARRCAGAGADQALPFYSTGYHRGEETWALYQNEKLPKPPRRSGAAIII